MSADKQLIARVVTALRNNLAQLLQELDDILDQFAPPEARKVKKPAAPAPAAGPERIPQLDIAELNDAEWTSYATKQKAQPGEAAWLKNPEHFTTYQAPPVILELLAAIKRGSTKSLPIGDMEYFLSGQGKFISRKPIKQEGAR